MDADEAGGVAGAFLEEGEGDGGGVAGDDGGAGEDVFEGAVESFLGVDVFDDGFDGEAAVFEKGVVLGQGEALHDGGGVVAEHAFAGHFAEEAADAGGGAAVLGGGRVTPVTGCPAASRQAAMLWPIKPMPMTAAGHSAG